MLDPLGAFCPHGGIEIPGLAHGPLSGLTFAAKDLFDVKGYVTGAGNPDWLRTHSAAEETADAVRSLLEAGADLAGKTVTDELAYSLNGQNIHYGTPVNSVAPERIPGGSSSGSASAVAGGLVDFAIGTDTSGSVRIPASYCGLFGIRPTHGRVSLRGVVPLAPGFDTVGWFARDAALLRRVGAVLLGNGLPAVMPDRLLIADDAFALASNTCRAGLQAGASRIAERATSVRHIELCGPSIEKWLEVHNAVKDYESWQSNGSWIQAVKPKLGPDIERRFLIASKITADRRDRAQEERIGIRSRMVALLQGGTILCLPTAPGPAPLKSTPPEALEDLRHRTLLLTCIAGLAGLPQITLPLGRCEGCPVGISLIAAPGKDEDLLAFAELVEGEKQQDRI